MNPASMFNSVVTISRPTLTLDAAGATVKRFAVTASNVPCMIVRESGIESVREGRTAEVQPVSFIFDPGVSIDARDRLVYGTEVFEAQTVTTHVGRSGLADYILVIAEATR